MVFRPDTMYWLAADGRIFSGSKQNLIQASDPEYQAYVASHLEVRNWPRDIAGNQTTASLQDVLTPYGMFADLASYAADVRWRKEVGGLVIDGVLYPTDRETQSKLGQAFLLASADSTETFKWKLADGRWTPSIEATTMQAVAKTVGAFVNGLYKKEDAVSEGIASGTITTRAQVDAAFS